MAEIILQSVHFVYQISTVIFIKMSTTIGIYIIECNKVIAISKNVRCKRIRSIELRKRLMVW